MDSSYFEEVEKLKFILKKQGISDAIIEDCIESFSKPKSPKASLSPNSRKLKSTDKDANLMSGTFTL